MASTSEYFQETKESIENYIQNRVELLRLQAIEKASKMGSSLILVLIMSLLAFFMLLFLSFMLAWLFANLTGNVYVGFAIMAGIFILMLLVIILGKKAFERKITDTIINSIFSKSNEQDDEDEHYNN